MKKIISLTMILSLLLVMMAGCRNANAELGTLAELEEHHTHTLGEEQVHLPNQPAQMPEPTDDPITDVPIETPLAVQDLTAEATYTEEFPTTALDGFFVQGQMDFSVDLFRRVAQKERCKNTLIAPMSVSLALAMAANGAEGQTLAEMEQVLGGHSIEKLNVYYLNWRAGLQGSEKTKLRIADSIWIRDIQGFEAEDAFLAANAKYYDAQVFKAPFNEIGEKAINEWVDEKTDGMIPQLIDDLNPDTMMILINALAFDAQWKEPYNDHQIKDGIFHSIDGKEQKAKMMSSVEGTYLEGDGVIGFARNYASGRYAFGALLPTEQSLEDYVASLDGETFLALLQGKQETEVYTQLPQFSCSFACSMNEMLEAMGMPSAFIGGFGKMSNDDLLIGDVLHKAVIEVHRDGTRAYAATAVEMNKNSGLPTDTKEVILDRPFIYFIYDCETNLPIFIGTLTSLQ